MGGRLRIVCLAAIATLVGCGVRPPVAPTTVATRAIAHGDASLGGFTDLQGRPVSLDSYIGQPIVLTFLSPKNSLSQAEVPLLLRLAGAYQPEGVAFVAVGEDATSAELSDFSNTAELTFPLWQDQDGTELARRRFTGVPATQFIDRQGRVVASKQGFLSKGELLENIAKIVP